MIYTFCWIPCFTSMTYGYATSHFTGHLQVVWNLGLMTLAFIKSVGYSSQHRTWLPGLLSNSHIYLYSSQHSFYILYFYLKLYHYLSSSLSPNLWLIPLHISSPAFSISLYICLKYSPVFCSLSLFWGIQCLNHRKEQVRVNFNGW
jgi:hypothetical protein